MRIAVLTRALFPAMFVAPNGACYDALVRLSVSAFMEPHRRVRVDCALGGFVLGSHVGLEASIHDLRRVEAALRRGSARSADLALYSASGTFVGWLELRPYHLSGSKRIAPRLTRAARAVPPKRHRGRGHDSRHRAQLRTTRRTARQHREQQRNTPYHPFLPVGVPTVTPTFTEVS